jgi:nicotinamidase-related amidase
MTGAAGRQLVVVDMQEVFRDSDSAWWIPRFEEIVPTVTRLVEAHLPNVVMTRFVPSATPSGAWLRYYERWPFAAQNAAHEMWQIVQPLRADASAGKGGTFTGTVVDKSTFSKWGPELERLVGPLGQMILAGVSTDCCVISTALAAADAGVEVLIAAQACAGIDDSAHEQALQVMALYDPLIKIISLDEALELRRPDPMTTR